MNSEKSQTVHKEDKKTYNVVQYRRSIYFTALKALATERNTRGNFMNWWHLSLVCSTSFNLFFFLFISISPSLSSFFPFSSFSHHSYFPSFIPSFGYFFVPILLFLKSCSFISYFLSLIFFSSFHFLFFVLYFIVYQYKCS